MRTAITSSSRNICINCGDGDPGDPSELRGDVETVFGDLGGEVLIWTGVGRTPFWFPFWFLFWLEEGDSITLTLYSISANTIVSQRTTTF